MNALCQHWKVLGRVDSKMLTREWTLASVVPRDSDSSSLVFPAPFGCPMGRGAQIKSFTPFPTYSQKDMRMTAREPSCSSPACACAYGEAHHHACTSEASKLVLKVLRRALRAQTMMLHGLPLPICLLQSVQLCSQAIMASATKDTRVSLTALVVTQLMQVVRKL